MNLSVVIITYNSGDTLSACLASVRKLAKEIILIDGHSQDNTLKIAKEYSCEVRITGEKDLGKKKAFGLRLARYPWVLALDSDEVVSENLVEEIMKLDPVFDGYIIPFANHFLGRRLRFGGEDYKMLRLFKKSAANINPALVHEHFQINGKTGLLKGEILHYSYRSLSQMYKKFTGYAVAESIMKYRSNEKSSIKKIFLYPLHMVYARFIEDKGYKDGLWRLPLDFGFGYMEFLTYSLLMFYQIRNKSEKI